MNKRQSAQVFSAVAIAIGLAVSYYAPANNGEAIWSLVSMFLGHASRDLFSDPIPPT